MKQTCRDCHFLVKERRSETGMIDINHWNKKERQEGRLEGNIPYS